MPEVSRNVFLMNCGQCITLEELRFIMASDLRIIKEVVDDVEDSEVVEVEEQVSDSIVVDDVDVVDNMDNNVANDVTDDVQPPIVDEDAPEEPTPVVAVTLASSQTSQKSKKELHRKYLSIMFSSILVRDTPQDVPSGERHNCCICQEETSVACYPENCHNSHTMCYPECVSKYAYMKRLEQEQVTCPHCRCEFHNIVVNGETVPIPELSDVTRQLLPSFLQNDIGCDLCWGIYNPIPAPERFYHNKRAGHRGRHRTMPFQYQQIVEITENEARERNDSAN